jgi:hypothetical protein
MNFCNANHWSVLWRRVARLFVFRPNIKFW